jgi:hypothetical protein
MATTTNTTNTTTHTCLLTTKAYAYGGTHDDSFVDVCIDSSGNTYAAGNTYSSAYSNGEQDIVVFQFDKNGDVQWGRYWGSTLSETATGIALDDGEKHFYVSGYSNTVGTLSVSKYDMFVIKFVVSTGLI